MFVLIRVDPRLSVVVLSFLNRCDRCPSVLSLSAGQAQGGVVVAEFVAEGFDDEVVVFALGQAGDGDGAEDARSGDVDGEAAAVGGVVGVGQGVFFGERGVVVPEVEAELVGAAMETGYDVRFALDPAGVVGRGAGECGVEERLVGLAEAADVDDDGVAASDGELAQGEAEPPCGLCVEGGEDELGFLPGDQGEVFREVGVGHGFFPLRRVLLAELRGDILAERKCLQLQPFYMRRLMWPLSFCREPVGLFGMVCGSPELGR